MPFQEEVSPVSPCVIGLESTRVPMSFFCRLLLLFVKPKVLSIEKVLPPVTSMALLAWFMTKVRPAEWKVPSARRPAVAELVLTKTSFVAFPSASLLVKASTPAETLMAELPETVLDPVSAPVSAWLRLSWVSTRVVSATDTALVSVT